MQRQPCRQAALADLALFRGSELSWVLTLDQLDRTAGLLHRLARALGHASDLEGQLGLELALAEQPDAVLAAASKACGLQRVVVERALDIELAGIDRLLDGADVHLGIILGEDVVEAALRHPHVEWHLAALKAVDRHARARLGALLAATGGLAETRADAAADTDAALARALVVLEFVEFHVRCTRFRFCRACPRASGALGLGRFFDRQQMRHLADLAEHFRGALHFHATVQLVEPGRRASPAASCRGGSAIRSG